MPSCRVFFCWLQRLAESGTLMAESSPCEKECVAVQGIPQLASVSLCLRSECLTRRHEGTKGESINQSPVDAHEFPLCASVASCETPLFLETIRRRQTRRRKSKDSGFFAG